MMPKFEASRATKTAAISAEMNMIGRTSKLSTTASRFAIDPAILVGPQTRV
jgi:hypothetical protein